MFIMLREKVADYGKASLPLVGSLTSRFTSNPTLEEVLKADYEWLKVERVCRKKNANKCGHRRWGPAGRKIVRAESCAPRGTFNCLKCTPHEISKERATLSPVFLSFFVYISPLLRHSSAFLSSHIATMSDREFNCKASILTLSTCTQTNVFGFNVANDDLSLPKGITEFCNYSGLK